MRDSIGELGRKTIDSEEYEASKTPMVWRITRRTGEVQYFDDDMIRTLIQEQMDVTTIIRKVGELFEAVDVRPLYEREIRLGTDV